jgi:hypothetical protein
VRLRFPDYAALHPGYACCFVISFVAREKRSVSGEASSISPFPDDEAAKRCHGSIRLPLGAFNFIARPADTARVGYAGPSSGACGDRRNDPDG